MSETLAANMIVPDVWADMVAAEFIGRLVFGNGGNGFTLTDGRLTGNPGDTIHFPRFKPMAEFSDLTEGVPIVTDKLETDESTVVVKEAGKGVEISDTALLTGFGDPLAEIRRQFGVLAARKVDASLVTSAGAAGAYLLDTNAAISWNSIVDGIALFGDEWDPADFAGFVIHSKQNKTILKDANFIARDKMGEAAVIPRGVVGLIGGVPVYMTDRVAVVGSEYDALLVKRSALGLFYKRRPIVETDRDILKRTTVLTTNVHFATKRINDRGVCILRTTEV